MGSHNAYFSNLKVLDFTGEIGAYTGKMFSGFGADVVHVEPITGNPLRNLGPFHKNTPGPERSLQFLYYHSGKRGLAINLEHQNGKKIFKELCARSDLLIESCVPGYLEGLGLAYEDLNKDNPRLVHTAITPFGHSGPLAEFPASDMTCAALGGFLNLAGVDHEKPVRAPDHQSYRSAEAYAAVGSSIALFNAMKTGQGQFVDVSCIEAAAMALENAAQYWDLEGKIRRGRGKEAGTATIHPCKDGYIVIVAIMGKNKPMWEPFVEWMKQEGVEDWETFEDEKWIEPKYRSSQEGYELFCRVFEQYTMQHDKLYLYEIGQKYKVAVTAVSDGKDLLENPQLQYRGFWQKVMNEDLQDEITFPGAPYEFSDLQWHVGQNAPRLGQHTAEILGDLDYSRSQINDLASAGAVYVC
ncbi:MAG: CoA transferase [Gammaproteobacteria bacterium]